MVGTLVIIGLLLALAILGNYVDSVQRYDPRVQEFEQSGKPKREHYFGTD